MRELSKRIKNDLNMEEEEKNPLKNSMIKKYKQKYTRELIRLPHMKKGKIVLGFLIQDPNLV